MTTLINGQPAARPADRPVPPGASAGPGLTPAEPSESGITGAITSTRAAIHRISLALSDVLAENQQRGSRGLHESVMLRAARLRLQDARSSLHAAEALLLRQPPNLQD